MEQFNGLRTADEEVFAPETEGEGLGDARQGLSQEARQPLIGGQIVRLMIDIVAAEKLVGPFAGENHLYVIPGHFRDKI